MMQRRHLVIVLMYRIGWTPRGLYSLTLGLSYMDIVFFGETIIGIIAGLYMAYF
jgi:hypothetical protein